MTSGKIHHIQTTIRVNAECDKGVAPLVSALNELDGVITLDSCEHGAFEGAFVFFTYGDTWQDLAHLLQTISSELCKNHLNYGYTLRIEWFGSNERPRAQILVFPEHVVALAENIRTLAGEINLCMSGSVGDKTSKALRN